MSELSSQRAHTATTRPRRSVVACFCEPCNRLLYVTDADVLFCPVCSSAVAPLLTGPEEDVPVRKGIADR